MDDGVLESFSPFLLGYCNCGCGGILSDLVQEPKKPRRFINHHNGRGKYSGNWTGGKSDNGVGYIKLSGYKGHPNADVYGRLYEHVAVMVKKIGRPLKKGENVHHINHIRNDNRPENLELFSSNSEHISKTTKKDMSNRFCSHCKSTRTHVRLRSKKTGNRMACWFKDGNGGWLCRKCYRILIPNKAESAHKATPI